MANRIVQKTNKRISKKTCKRTNKRISKKTCKKPNKRTSKKTNKKTCKKPNRRRQRGGNFNEDQIKELTEQLKVIGFVEPELSEILKKYNDISQIQGKDFDAFINHIYEQYDPVFNNITKEEAKQKVRDWLSINYETQMDRVTTDTEYSTDTD
jgi:hypothetical protein